MTKRGVG